MYLYLEKYESVSRWDANAIEKAKDFYPEKLQELGKKHLERNFLSKETKYQVGYWRKANAIHKWFVDNCGDGEDCCQLMGVGKEQLEELLNLVEEVLLDHSKASKLLPSQSGFFFGTHYYDEWYFEELKYTKELIERVLDFLKDNGGYLVYYQASW